MAASRKIVLILGNGFDLDLGLKTSYKDFWESEFCPKDYPAPLIHHLNQRWTDRLDNVKWYDLENELSEYYLKITNRNEGDDYITNEERVFIKSFEPYKWNFGVYNDKSDIVNSLLEKGVIHISNEFPVDLNVLYREDIAHPPV